MIHLKDASPDNLDFVYECICVLEEQTFDKNTFERFYLNNQETPDIRMLLICQDELPIGYMSIHIQTLLHHCGRVAEIQELVVLPEYRNAGAGKIAIEFAIQFSKEKDCVLLELASNLKRTDAHRFYLANGFSQSHYKFTKKL